MDKTRSLRTLGSLVAALAALSLPLVTVMVGLRISPVDRPPVPLFGGYWIPVALGQFLLAFALYVFLVSRVRPWAFAVAGTASAIGLELAAGILGVAVHRDFFTSAFSQVPAFILVFLFWLNAYSRGEIRKEIRRDIGIGFIVFFVLMVAWIMLMGYAIATRKEPRPIESLAYNAYNTLAAFGILMLSRMVVISTYRIVTVGDAGIRVGGSSLDKLLGEGEQAILRAFLESPERRLTCADIEGRMRAASGGEGAREEPPCASCEPGASKATACARYRNIYNRMLVIKKVLEFTEIGTILPPKNKKNVLEEGWKLALFSGVRIRKG